ncbi:MAG: DUF488 family protein [Bacteroidales bacterium]|nr:DUF488 family protein [Bacteroidales bacterium]
MWRFGKRSNYEKSICKTKQIKELESKHHTITLLYAAKDTEHNHAKVLEAVLKE